MLKYLAGASALTMITVGALHAHDATLYRVFVGDHDAARVTAVDLADDDHTWTFDTVGQAKLYPVSGGSVVAAVQTENDTVQFFQSGISLQDHGDHSDVVIGEPAGIHGSLVGPRPAHLIDHGGKVLINYDKGGYADVVDGYSLGEGKIVAAKFPQSEPHHGFIATLGKYWISTVGPAAPASGDPLPRLGLQEFTEAGAPVGELATCTAVHGEAFSGAYLAAGCREGILTATAGDNGVTFAMLPYPADLPSGVTTGTLLGATGIQMFLGNYGPKGLVVVDPADEPHFRYIELPFRRVDFVLDPAKPSEGYVLTEDGTLHKVDLLNAKLGNSTRITTPYSMDGHWNDARPRLAVAGDDIVMTDPDAGVLRVISTKDLTEEKAIKIDGKPFNLTVVGGSGVQH